MNIETKFMSTISGQVILKEFTTAIIVTRGDVDIYEIVKKLESCFKSVKVWNNGETQDVRVFGRYLAATYSNSNFVYVQDDDVFLEDYIPLAEAWEPGELICNMPKTHRKNYPNNDIALVGFGSFFEKELIEHAFKIYCKYFEMDKLFFRECDRVFSALNQKIYLDLPYRSMFYANNETRMYREAEHQSSLQLITKRINHIKQMEGMNILAPIEK